MRGGYGKDTDSGCSRANAPRTGTDGRKRVEAAGKDSHGRPACNECDPYLYPAYEKKTERKSEVNGNRERGDAY